MVELVWLHHLPDDSLESGIDVVNQLYWNITVFQGSESKIWYVMGGEKTILKTDSREVVDAFLYGLALAYSVLPPPVFDQLRDEVRKWVE
jgi:hypothetical protein